MASTTFVPGTVIASTWLNDVNTATYKGGFVYLESYTGVDPTGVGTSDVGMAAAIADAQVKGANVKAGVGTFRFTAPIAGATGVSIVGSGCGGAYTATGGATVFYFNHTGIGIVASGSSNRYEYFRTLRDQPADKPGWTPNANAYDIDTTVPVNDVYFQNIIFTNPTKAVAIRAGSGRVWFDKIGGQPMTSGIFIEAAYDVVRMHQIHWWPYWSQGPNIQQWTLNNCIGIDSWRNDDPTLDDYFAIWLFKAINIGQWTNPGAAPNLPAGTTALLKMSNVQFDICQYGYYVDPASIAHTSKWTNTFFQGCQQAQSTISVTGGTAFSSFVAVSGNNYTLTLTGNAVVPVAGTYIYLNVGTGTAATGWYLIASVTNANVFVVTAAASGLTMTAATLTLTQKTARGLSVLGTGCRVQGTNIQFAGWQRGMISVTTGNYVGLSEVDFLSWNTDAVSTDAGIIMTGTAEVRLAGTCIIGTSNGAALYIDGSGGIYRSPFWRGFTPVVTSQAGTISAYVVNQALFMNDQYTIKYMVDITITTVGSASGDIRFTLPNMPVAGSISAIAVGRETITSGVALVGTLGVGGATVIVTKYDNSFPATNGSRLVLTGAYAL